MANSYYSMISREVEKATRPLRAKARRYKNAFSQFGVFGEAAARMGSAATLKKSAPNYGRKKK
jgi:hypothetical protein